MAMTFGSVCSGILGAELAWEPLGWEPLWCSEIDKHACKVIKHQREGLLNHGDFTTARPEPVDVIGAGTPCQSLSDGGLRAGLDDPRGQLMLEFCRLVDRIRPTWFVWENVRGALSTQKGRALGTLFGAMAEIGYSFSWRLLNARFFGLAQNRQRVFVVGYLGDWRPPATVLFEPESLRGDNPKGRKSGKNSPSRSQSRFGARELSLVFDQQQVTNPHNRSRGNPISPTLTSRCDRMVVAKALTTRVDRAHDGSRTKIVNWRNLPRYLTPLECERLQGFPDDWTKLDGVSKLARYRMIGNAFPIPVVKWIGSRIQKVQNILEASK